MANSSIFSTLRYFDYPEWTQKVDILDRRGISQLESVRRIRRAADRYEVLVLDGTARAEQVAAAVVARMRRPPRVIMAEATWKRGTSLLDRFVCAAGMRAMQGPHITFCVLSSWDLDRFPRVWGIPADKVRFTPFCCTISEQEPAQPPSPDGGVFAGGDSLRDYGPLLEAASRIDTEVTIASRWLVPPPGAPPNLTVAEVSPQRFQELCRKAAVVVVALGDSDDRSAGQQSFLNAMLLGKIVVVTDAPGVRDYVEDGKTGLIVPIGDTEALVAAVDWAIDPANREAVEAICANAREAVLNRFTRRDYIASLFGLIEEQQAAAERRGDRVRVEPGGEAAPG